MLENYLVKKSKITNSDNFEFGINDGGTLKIKYTGNESYREEEVIDLGRTAAKLGNTILQAAGKVYNSISTNVPIIPEIVEKPLANGVPRLSEEEILVAPVSWSKPNGTPHFSEGLRNVPADSIRLKHMRLPVLPVILLIAGYLVVNSADSSGKIPAYSNEDTPPCPATNIFEVFANAKARYPGHTFVPSINQEITGKDGCPIGYTMGVYDGSGPLTERPFDLNGQEINHQ